jgi:hypothetical protein
MSRKQKFPPRSVIGITGADSDSNDDRPSTLASLSVETPVASDRSLAVPSRRSWGAGAPTREDIGKALNEKHEVNIFSA